MKRIIAIIVLIVSVNVCFAQNWSSEAEINNYYNDKINQKKAEVSILERQLENEKSRFYYDDNKIFHGDLNAQENAIKLGSEIAFLKAEIKSLESARSSNINSFRQVQKDKQEAERQIEEQKRRNTERQIEERKRRNTERQREIQEDNQKRVDEQNRNREEEARRREERRKEEERKRQEAINEAIQDNLAINAPAYYRDLSHNSHYIFYLHQYLYLNQANHLHLNLH